MARPPLSRQVEGDLDDLGDLPPLDGGGEDDDHPDEPLEHDVGVDEAAGLDDRTGEDDPVDVTGLELPDGEESWLDDGAADPAVADDGEILPELDLGDSRLTDTEEAGVGGDDPGSGDQYEGADVDSGEEGPIDADEELRDEDLPALDADDEETGTTGDLSERGWIGDQAGACPDWAENPWPRVGAPVPVMSASAVASAGRGAVVSGRTETGAAVVLRVDLEGQVEEVSGNGLEGAPLKRLDAQGEHIAAVTFAGRLFLSEDGGGYFVRRLVDDVSDVVLSSGCFWVRTRARSLFVAVNGGPLRPCPTSGPVGALASDGSGGVVGLVLDSVAQPAAFLIGTGKGAVEERRTHVNARLGPPVLAARAGLCAFASGHRVAIFSQHSGWQSARVDGQLTALQFLDDAGALIAAAYSDADDSTSILRFDLAGRARLVARVGPAHAEGDHDGRVTGLAYDEARGVLWVAGGFGLVAFGVR